MAGYQSPFERALQERLLAEIEHDKDVLALGHAIKSHEDYQKAVGRISALRSVLGYCDEIRDDLRKAQS